MDENYFPVYDPEWPILCRSCRQLDERMTLGPDCARCVWSGLYDVDMKSVGKRPLELCDRWRFFAWREA